MKLKSPAVYISPQDCKKLNWGIFFTNAFLEVVPNGFTPLFLETEIPQRIEYCIHEVQYRKRFRLVFFCQD